jgi:hypothetical protein
MPDSRELPNIACCNFSGNAEGDWEDEIAPLLNNDGNFSEDPQYCGSIGTGNISLQSDSPCLAAHNDCAQQIGAMPMGCGSSASLVSSWSQVKALY